MEVVTRTLSDNNLAMLLHEIAFKWSGGSPMTYAQLLQDLFSSNCITPLIIPDSLTELHPFPPAVGLATEFNP